MLVSEAIGNDHKYLDELYSLIKSSNTIDDKIKYRNMLTWNLARHAISEELTIYPAMETYLGVEGKELTSTDFTQHQAIKEDLYTLQTLHPSDPKFSPLLENLITDLHTHIQHESEEDMPRLEAAMSQNSSEKLAIQFARTKWFVPTRSHPGAPTFSTLAEGLTGLLVAPIDKLRDLMRTFPEGEGKGTEVDWLGMITGKAYSVKGEEGKWVEAGEVGSGK